MFESSSTNSLALCRCGSGRVLDACCGAWIAAGDAPTAEALMRSRFTAYALGKEGYLLATWHSSTRPDRLDLATGPRWLRLEIRSVEAGGETDHTGVVEFVAHWQEGNRYGTLHEASRFAREMGHWRYVEGTIHPAAVAKVGRNDPCPCGSGRKWKQCCGA